MKKLVSILAVVAMLFAFCGTAAFAADQTITLSVEETTYNAGDEFDLTIEAGSCGLWGIVVDFNEEMFEIMWDEDNDDYLYDTGSFTGTLVMNPNGAANCFSIGGMRNKNSKVSATVSIKVKDDAPSGKFTFNAVSAGEKSNAKADGTILSVEIEGADEITIVGAEPDEEKVVMTAAPFITEVATSTEAEGWQAGQAVALQFNPADLAEFDAMNWKLTVAGVNKFAKVDDAAFATIKATAAETVDVFASFIVNTAENTEATPITAVSAGFKKADGTVVEAE